MEYVVNTSDPNQVTSASPWWFVCAAIVSSRMISIRSKRGGTNIRNWLVASNWTVTSSRFLDPSASRHWTIFNTTQPKPAHWNSKLFPKVVPATRDLADCLAHFSTWLDSNINDQIYPPVTRTRDELLWQLLSPVTLRRHDFSKQRHNWEMSV
jgi:hypothetical protein